MDLARRGEIARAISWGEEAAAEAPDNAGLFLFLGLLHARGLDLEAALPHLARAAALTPGDRLSRMELARALIGLGRLAEAGKALDGLSPAGRRPTNCCASAAFSFSAAASIAKRRGSTGPPPPTIRAISRAGPSSVSACSRSAILKAPSPRSAQSLALRPDQPAIRAKLAEAQAAAGQATRA